MVRPLFGLALCLLVLCTPIRSQNVDGTIYPRLKFEGEIASDDDVDVLEFQAVAGTLLSVAAKADKKEPILPLIVVEQTAGGAPLGMAAAGKKKAALKKLLLPDTGIYRILISGDQGTTGGYSVTVKEKVPKSVRRVVTKESVAGGADLVLSLDALPGDLLSGKVLVKGKTNEASPGTPALDGPGGALPLGDALKTNASGSKLSFAKLPADALGPQELRVPNVGETGEFIARLLFKRPKMPKGVLVEDDPGGGGGGGGDPDLPGSGPTVATDFGASIAFLYTGPDAPQTGVDPDVFEDHRIAVMTGLVLARGGQPIEGAKVTLVGEDDFGETLSDDTGRWAMALNGGGQHTMEVTLAGHLPVHRTVRVPWREFAPVEDVILTPLDGAVTTVTGGGAAQMAQGSLVTDDAGSRQATVLWPAGTTAQMVLPGGGRQPLSSLDVRATEYTVGDEGPMAMPAVLPPASAYTYCVELSADEALAAGATSVEFSTPLPFYVENYLDFPVGGDVPLGSYDRETCEWVPSPDGRVLAVVSESAGEAELDLDGDGDADGDDQALYADFGIDSAELQTLATLYEPGQELWRVSIPHFTPWDCNWPFTPPSGSGPPDVNPVKRVNPDGTVQYQDPCEEDGSIVEVANQVLGEAIPLAGIDMDLVYRSDRVPGRLVDRQIEIPVSGSAVHPSLQEVEVSVFAQGKSTVETFPPLPDQATSYTWNPVDVFGQPVYGPVDATVTVSNRFPLVYTEPADFAAAFAAFGGTPFVANPGLMSFDSPLVFTRTVGVWDARAQGLGGWALEDHHVYVPDSYTLLTGDGRRRRAAPEDSGIIEAFAGYGNITEPDGIDALLADLQVNDLALAPDGSLYASSLGFIHRIDTDGIIHRVAGDGTSNQSLGDGGLALDATICGSPFLAMGPDGSLYFSEQQCHVIRRIRPDGIVERVAGTGVQATFGVVDEDIQALDAPLSSPKDLAVGPDGTLYIADSSSGVIRRVGTDGVISTVAGVPGGSPNLTVDVPAKGLGIANPTVVAVAPDGSVLFDINGIALRRVDTQGIVRMVVNDTFGCFYSGEGVLASSASAEGVMSPVYGPDGTLYYAASRTGLIRSVGTDGILRTAAGKVQASSCGLQSNSSGDGGPALKADIKQPRALVLVPDGSIFVAEGFDGVRRVSSALPDFSADDLLIADEGGDELFRFDKFGRHLQTFDALTGAPQRTFLYDEDGRLIGVRDAEGSEVTIERDVAGEPTAIVGPYGHNWQLTLDPKGWLSTLEGPSGETWTLDSTDEGLLTSMQDPVGGLHTFTYDSLGRLELDQGPDGRSLMLARTVTSAPSALDDSEVSVTATSALGRQTTLDFSFSPDQSVSVLRTAPSGAVTGRTSQPSGDRTVSLPDGTLIMTEEGPDGRFGMEAPVTAQVFAMHPGGENLLLEGARQAALEDPSDLFSLTMQTEIVERNGFDTTRVWDSTTRTLTTTSLKGRAVVGELDALGRMVSLTEGPGLQPWTATYDALGRVTQLTYGTLVEQYTYDALGRVAQITDGLGRSQQLFYDASDRLTGVMAPSGRAWTVGNDALGRVTSMQMPSGDVHTYGYDGADRLATYTPPGGGTFTRSYSDDGEWTGTTLPGGRAVVSSYDPVTGDLQSVAAPEATTFWSWVSGGGGCCDTEQLDTLSRMPGVLGQRQSISYSYDGALETQQIWSGASNFTVGFGWDSDQALDSFTVEGKTRNLGRDNDGFLTQDGDFSLSRDFSTGVLTAVDDGTGRIDHTFDDLGRLVGRSLEVNGVTLLSWTLGHDVTGRLSSVSETVDGVSVERGYSFDVDGRLVEETLDGPVVGSWGYDVNGNRTSAPAGVATYDMQDRITGFAGTSWTVDTDGFLVARGPDTFVHDARGRMLQATVAGTTATYSYDGLGRRSAVHVGANTWEYLYADLFSPWSLTACREPDGTLTLYQYDEAGSLYAFDRDGVRFYVGCDHLGTPRVVADSTGVAVKVVDLDAWGAVVSDSDPGFELPVGFAGGLTDPVTGFVRLGLRDYDPATGRFLTRDPTLIASAQTNLYAYCDNDPLDRLDRSGLAFCVKAKGYQGYGAEGQFCISTEGVSFCSAVGLGVGAGFELEPFGELAKSGTYNEISIKGKLGPIGIGPKWKFTECEFGKLKFDCDVGPINLCQGKGKKKDLTEKPPLSGPKLKDYLKKILKFKFGLEGVVNGGACARITW